MASYEQQARDIMERAGDEHAQSRTACDVVELANILVEIERLRAIVDKLPKTADGVPVVPGMVLWPPVDCWLPPLNEGEESQEAGGTVGMTVCDILTGDDVTEYAAIERCYSTREAAEAAKEE